MRKIALYIVLAILMLQIVSAIGISPAKKTFDLDLTNSIGNGKIRVINNAQKEMRVVIEVQGAFADYLQFTKKDFVMNPEQGEDLVEYSIDISEIPRSKLKSAKMSIYVIEIPSSMTFSGSGAVAGTAAIQKLIINIPAEISAEEVKTDVEDQQASVSETAETGQDGPDYVPLEDAMSAMPEDPGLEKPKKSGRSTLVYIVITLVALNLLWLIYLFRKKDKKD